MRVWPNNGLSDRYYCDEIFGIRPVVCLKANVELVKTNDDLGIPNSECYQIQF